MGKGNSKGFYNLFPNAIGNVVNGMSFLTHSLSGVPGSIDGMVALK